MKHKCPRWQQSPKLAIFSIKVTIKVRRSLTLVSFEKVSLVEYACLIWGSIYIILLRPSEGMAPTIYDIISMIPQQYTHIKYISLTRHDVFVKHGCPQRQQSQSMAKISKSYILTPLHPKGYGISVKFEEPLCELTVKVWLLDHHPNFNYWTSFVSRTELQTDRQTDRWTNRRTNGWQTDDPITRCPWGTFQAGGIKRSHFVLFIKQRYIDQIKIFSQNLCCREVKIDKILWGDLPYFALKCEDLPK